MPTEATLFFDLDGTLTDPKPGITGSIQYALGKLGRAVPSQDELAWCIGPPLRASFVALLGGEDHADRAVELYRERFGDVGLFERRIIDHFALACHFEDVFGSELDGTRVHKADLLSFALQQTGADPSRSL